jgi:hypothetical protein
MPPMQVPARWVRGWYRGYCPPCKTWVPSPNFAEHGLSFFGMKHGVQQDRSKHAKVVPTLQDRHTYN